MAKKKLKKILKGAALLGALGLGASALGKRRQMKNFLKTEGGDKSDMRNYGPFSKSRGFIPMNMMTAEDMANDEMFLNAMKKGGRVKKTKFSKKKKQQANRSKKK